MSVEELRKGRRQWYAHNHSTSPRAQIRHGNWIRLRSSNDDSMTTDSVADLDDFRSSILLLLEINEMLCPEAHGKLPPLVACVDNNWPKTHCFSKLNSLDTDTPTAAGEDSPLSGSQS